MRARVYTVHHTPPTHATVNATFQDFFVDDYASTGDTLAARLGADLADSCAEMRAHYWVWKNVADLDVVGFQHYRRWFCWDGRSGRKVKSPAFRRALPNLMSRSAARLGRLPIVPRKVYLGCPISLHYRGVHDPAHWDVLEGILRERGATDEDYRIHHLSPCNMLVMRWPDFDAYMTHWLDVMNAVAPRISIEPDGYQRRALGFMSERIFTLWLRRSGLSVAELDLLVTD